MVNHKHFLRAYQSLKEIHERLVLVTLVRVDGSTYRKPGARLLITEQGQMTGLVSGGCLENGLVLEAKKVFASGVSKILEIDMRAEEGSALALSLGCNGLVQLHLQLLDLSQDNILDGIGHTYLTQDAGVTLLSLAEGELNPGWYYKSRGCEMGNIKIDGDQLETLEAEIAEVDNAGPKPGQHSAAFITELAIENAGAMPFYVERIIPPYNLLVLGAGPDVFPVCEIASTLGWYIHVVDHRPGRSAKFDASVADLLSRVKPDELASRVELNRYDGALLMSHNLQVDATHLRQLLDTSVSYIGLLGPRYRGEELADQCGIALQDYAARVFSPVGLNLGGEGPASIALSIVAQIQAQFNSGSGENISVLKS